MFLASTVKKFEHERTGGDWIAGGRRREQAGGRAKSGMNGGKKAAVGKKRRAEAAEGGGGGSQQASGLIGRRGQIVESWHRQRGWRRRGGWGGATEPERVSLLAARATSAAAPFGRSTYRPGCPIMQRRQRPSPAQPQRRRPIRRRDSGASGQVLWTSEGVPVRH